MHVVILAIYLRVTIFFKKNFKIYLLISTLTWGNYPFYSSHSFYLSNINELINEEGYENVNKNYTDI